MDIPNRKEFDFSDFIKKINDEGDKAIDEIKNGKKTSHWMWYFFPQLSILGTSYNSKYYGIISCDEANAFLQNKILKNFLTEITYYVYLHLKNKTRTITEIFGNIDNNKFLSCMTLFYYAAKSQNNKEVTKLFKYCKRKAEKELKHIDEKTINMCKK